MKPPALAQALVGAVAPADDYEFVAGDLHEEYVRLLRLSGAKSANRWYWAQALLSIPSLLSYSRSPRSTLHRVRIGITTLAVLSLMLVVHVVLSQLLGTSISTWAFLGFDYTDVMIFGALLARLVRTGGPRIALFASSFLVFCFVLPALAGHPGSRAPLIAWIVLFGTIPAMCLGASLYQAITRRISSTT